MNGVPGFHLDDERVVFNEEFAGDMMFGVVSFDVGFGAGGEFGDAVANVVGLN